MPLSQHPIPQHVTGFEFRLIGNLTLKQFGYLAFGGLFAWVFFSSPLPPLFRVPIAGFFAFSGIAFAFIPIQGRPLDKWLWAFFVAIIRPTQRIWKKEGEGVYFLEMSFIPPAEGEAPQHKIQVAKKILEKYLTRFALEGTPLDERVSTFLSSLDFGVSLPAKVAQAAVSRVKEVVPKKEAVGKKVEEEVKPPAAGKEKIPLAKEDIIIPLAGEVNFTEQEVITLPSPTFRPTYLAGVGMIRPRKLSQRPDLTSQFLPIRGERRFELSEALSQRFGVQKEPPVPQLNIPKIEEVMEEKKENGQKEGMSKEAKEQPTQVQQVPTVVLQQKAPSKLPRLTNVPNVLQGLVHDEEGHLLDETIIVVKNEAGIPVRALKTNKLGQYIISTPLGSGRYLIETEKENYNFDILSFEAKGEVIEPIEIIGKKAPAYATN